MSSDSTVPFETILRRTHPLDDAEDASSAPVAPWYVPPFRDSARTHDDTAAAGPARGGYGADDPRETDSTPLPHSIAAGDISEELDLAACDDIPALLVRRRQFARENHPDRVPAELRENATIRMMIANGLIDAEILRRRSDWTQSGRK